MSALPSTSAALLERLRLRPHDQAAWSKFVDLYGTTIFRWANERGLVSRADCEDVTQVVLLRIHEIMPAFRYDPSRSFRGLLRQITNHALLDCARRLRGKDRADGSDATADLLLSEPAREDLVQRLERAYDLVAFEHACQLVRLRVDPQVWEAYRLALPVALGGDGLSNEEAALRLGVDKVRIERAKHRFKVMLTEELSRLSGPNDAGPDSPLPPPAGQE
jgi:RNA polymerase sigma-70 factor (ECF subfamily)